ncbi:putative conjugal transfer protein TraC [Rhizobium dioscoreae]|uniref:conjugal transfer protein TraC n=1 Tax=Rhizobium TaxID=379 RepID=UPI00119914B8|nr:MULTISPECIES: conjugal transfer protein TraC [Rhizobium]TWB12127.1 TraC-like protein [Rhizobium sp. ERR1071]GES46333.1 putative conjugal transfer protein TraC [Rhizobium dioscoreae]
MKRPSSKIRDEIARLQEQLKAAETREAERIGRIALKAGLGETEIDEAELQAAFENIAQRFRAGQDGGSGATTGGEKGDGKGTTGTPTAMVPPGAAQGGGREA